MVTDARERVHGPVGQPVEQVGGIAEGLGEPAPGGEVQIAGGLVRDVAVHGRDLAVELLEIHARGLEICGVCMHAGSFTGAPS